MSLVHEVALRTACLPSHIQLACDGGHLALPHTRSCVGVWSLDDLSTKPLELVGHRKQLTALCFGTKSNPKLLCSAAEDYIIVWHVQRARLCHDRGEVIKGVIIGTTLGYIQYLTFSPDDGLVAACAHNEVLILDSTKEKVHASLEGHVSPVTCVQFCPHYTSTVVSISEDRTFKVWNIAEAALIFQSSIVSASPFISMAMNPNKEQVAIGTTDGQLRVYDLTDGNGFRCLHHVDVAKICNKLQCKRSEDLQINTGPITISSRPSWQRNDPSPGEEESTGEGQTEMGCAILGLSYTYQTPGRPDTSPVPSFLRRENSAVRDILNTAPVLVIGTTGVFLQVNAFTLEVCDYWSLQDPIPALNDLTEHSRTLMSAGSMSISQGVYRQIWCLVGSLFQNQVHVLRWDQSEIVDKNRRLVASGETTLEDDFIKNLSLCSSKDSKSCGTSSSEITILSNTPLLEDSILRAELVLKKKTEAKPGKAKPGSSSMRKGSQMTDQPLTFKSKVKSSGYTAAPRTGMFCPQTNFSKSSTTPTKPTRSFSEGIIGKEYPMASGAPSVYQTSQNVAERPTPINCVHFSDEGHSLACGLGNRAVQVFRMPLTGKGTAFTGHNGVVTRVHWSHDSQWLLSSSTDRSASVWCRGQSEPIMSITTVNNNFTVNKEASASKTTDKDNPQFSKEVRFAQFYYVDKFILLACGNTFYMYKYLLDTAREDIKRYLTKSRYKLVKAFAVGEAQTVTALRAINTYYSYITIVAGSDRSVSVYDLNVGQCARTMAGAHTKPCHVIGLSEGSAGVSHPSNVYDLFVTAAMTDCIKLWDIRTDRCVRLYEGHQNRCYPCGVHLSPCGRFLATGAEDKFAYIYDLRTGTYLHKLSGHTDVVSDVAFHPLKPQLVSACLDGKVRLFTDS